MHSNQGVYVQSWCSVPTTVCHPPWQMEGSAHLTQSGGCWATEDFLRETNLNFFQEQ